jgi:hypothetical protein
MYLIGITLAIWITRRRWRAAGGDPALVGDVPLWAVPAAPAQRTPAITRLALPSTPRSGR